MMKPGLLITSDGSHTLHLSELNESYHSVHGAVTESKHVFLRNGFQFCPEKSPTILEVGFGTGLNCLLTALEAAETKRKTIYYSIEKFPLEKQLVQQLNYPEIISGESLALFSRIHACEWNSLVPVSEYFFLRKIHADLLDFDWSTLPALNLVYFDAFGPDKQPEMWSPAILREICGKIAPGGVFVTYSAKGVVRRTLEDCSLEMQRIQGPPGKKEMLRGIKRK